MCVYVGVCVRVCIGYVCVRVYICICIVVYCVGMCVCWCAHAMSVTRVDAAGQLIILFFSIVGSGDSIR